MDYFFGGLGVVVAGALLFLAFIFGGVDRVEDAVQHCSDFGRFEHKAEWYSCQKIEG